MKKELPKNCLTCKHMDFVDDELDVLHCFESFNCSSNMAHIKDGIKTSEGNSCNRYELNKAVQDDADQG